MVETASRADGEDTGDGPVNKVHPGRNIKTETIRRSVRVVFGFTLLFYQLVFHQPVNFKKESFFILFFVF